MDRRSFHGSEICEEKSNADNSKSTVWYVRDTKLNLAYKEIFNKGKDFVVILIVYSLVGFMSCKLI